MELILPLIVWQTANAVQNELAAKAKAKLDCAKIALFFAEHHLFGPLSFIDTFQRSSTDEEILEIVHRKAKKLSEPDKGKLFNEIARRIEKANKMATYLDSNPSEEDKTAFLKKMLEEELEIEARVTKTKGVIFIPSTSAPSAPSASPPVLTKSAGGRKCATCGGPHVGAHCPLLKGAALPTAVAVAAPAPAATVKADAAWQTVAASRTAAPRVAAAPRTAVAAPSSAAASRLPAPAVGGAGASCAFSSPAFPSYLGHVCTTVAAKMNFPPLGAKPPKK